MKKAFQKFMLMVALLFLGATLCYAQDTQTLFLNDLTKTFSGIEKEPSFWPGLNMANRPFVIATCSNGAWGNVDHLYAFYFKPQNSIWQSVTVNGQPAYYSPRDIYGVSNWQGSLDLEKPYLNIDNQGAFIGNVRYGTCNISYYSDSELDQMGARLIDTLQESISTRIIDYILFDAPDAKQQLDSLKKILKDFSNLKYSDENVSLMVLERILLGEYLETGNEEALKNVVAIDIIRTSQMSPTEKAVEGVISNVYAIQEYASHKVIQFVGRTEKSFIKYYIGFDNSWFLDNPLPGKDCRLLSRDEIISILFQEVASITTYGADKVLPNWNNDSKFTNNTVIDLLQNHYKLSNEDIAQRVNLLKSKYNYANILETAKKKFALPMCYTGNSVKITPKNKSALNSMQKLLSK